MRTLRVQFQPGVTCHMKNEDCHIPLLESVFAAFPNIPINVDIKSNCDLLIDKVRWNAVFKICSIRLTVRTNIVRLLYSELP